MTVAVLIVAAGRGMRAGGGNAPKQYATLGAHPVLHHTLDSFNDLAPDFVQVVIHADDRDLYQSAVSGCALTTRLLPPVPGGLTRQASVRAGLEALNAHRPSIVLIHDAARPFVTATTIREVAKALDSVEAALAAAPVADTLKRAGAAGIVSETVARDGLWAAQTPQGFRFPVILAAHRAAEAAGRCDFTDDASLCEWSGTPVSVIASSALNRKITTAEDLAIAQDAFKMQARVETRTGTGFDVHKFETGDHVWLCGVKIAHTHGLEGHSDADAPLHALTDALLGAIGDGDIGQHFPPSDPKWKGAPSRLFLEDAARRVRAAGGRIVNVDITVLCEAPRIGPHRDAMRATIAGALQIDVSRVGVKATTTESMGFTGRREGLAALASANVELPIP